MGYVLPLPPSCRASASAGACSVMVSAREYEVGMNMSHVKKWCTCTLYMYM